MVSVDASPIMSHDYSLLELVGLDCVEGGFDPVDDNREILAPLDLLLRVGGVGKVDEEKSILADGLLPLKRFPNLMIIRPSLHEDNQVLAVLFALEVKLQWLG